LTRRYAVKYSVSHVGYYVTQAESRGEAEALFNAGSFIAGGDKMLVSDLTRDSRQVDVLNVFEVQEDV